MAAVGKSAQFLSFCVMLWSLFGAGVLGDPLVQERWNGTTLELVDRTLEARALKARDKAFAHLAPEYEELGSAGTAYKLTVFSKPQFKGVAYKIRPNDCSMWTSPEESHFRDPAAHSSLVCLVQPNIAVQSLTLEGNNCCLLFP